MKKTTITAADLRAHISTKFKKWNTYEIKNEDGSFSIYGSSGHCKDVLLTIIPTAA